MEPALAASTREIKLAGSAGSFVEWPSGVASLRSEYSVIYCAGRRAAKERWLSARTANHGLASLMALGAGGRGG